MCTPASWHRNLLNGLLPHVQWRGQQVGGCHTGVRKDGYLLSINETISDEKRGEPLSSQKRGDDDINEDVFLPFNPTLNEM